MDQPDSRNSTVGKLLRWSWSTATALVGLAGLLAVPLHMTAGEVLVVAMFAAMAGVGLAAGARGRAGPPDQRNRLPLVGALCGVAAVALTGLMLEVGPVALLLVVGLACAGWWMHHRQPSGRHPAHSGRDRSSAAGSPGETPLRLAGLGVADVDQERIGDMSIAELCLAWRRSYPALTSHVGGSDGWASVVELRRSVLDELERRDPSGFARWIATARAASDPGRFIPSRQQA